MQKTRKLFKARNLLIPWSYWGEIHLLLNTASFLALIIAIAFTGITELTSTWFTVCMIQYIPIFLALFITFKFESLLYKTVLSLIKKRLEQHSIDVNLITFSGHYYTLSNCVLGVGNKFVDHNYYNDVVDVVLEINKAFGSDYHIICSREKQTKTK